MSGLWYFKDELFCSVTAKANTFFTLYHSVSTSVLGCSVSQDCSPTVTLSNWCSDLHSTNCPRGTFCVSHLPPLAGREPAVEGSEL